MTTVSEITSKHTKADAASIISANVREMWEDESFLVNMLEAVVACHLAFTQDPSAMQLPPPGPLLAARPLISLLRGNLEPHELIALVGGKRNMGDIERMNALQVRKGRSAANLILGMASWFASFQA